MLTLEVSSWEFESESGSGGIKSGLLCLVDRKVMLKKKKKQTVSSF